VVGLVAAQVVGDPEPVDHRGLPAGAVEREAVEELEPGRVVGVRAVRVGQQLEVRVRGVSLRQVGLEVPEAAEDRLADVSDAPDESLAGLHRHGCPLHDAEPEGGDSAQPFGDAVVAIDHRVVQHRRPLLGDQGAIPQHPLDVDRRPRWSRLAEAGEELDR
jgi:hypothetical protein